MAGFVHVYCGDGKGKTTAAIGLAVRAAGCGKKVLVARFLKTDQSGEVAELAQMPGITIRPCDKSFGFFSQMTEEQKQEAREYYSQVLDETLERAVREEYDLLILDEVIVVSNFGLVDEGRITQFLRFRPMDLEVVLTGRDPSDQILRMADYVSEIRKVKHPYDKGILAREGIEY